MANSRPRWVWDQICGAIGELMGVLCSDYGRYVKAG